jgi:hypothetical protein
MDNQVNHHLHRMGPEVIEEELPEEDEEREPVVEEEPIEEESEPNTEIEEG